MEIYFAQNVCRAFFSRKTSSRLFVETLCGGPIPK